MEFLNLLFIYSPHVFYSHNLIYLKNTVLLNYLSQNAGNTLIIVDKKITYKNIIIHKREYK